LKLAASLAGTDNALWVWLGRGLGGRGAVENVPAVASERLGNVAGLVVNLG
jgi:hypothetical protein